MNYAVDSGQMRLIEEYTIRQGVSAEELMERAALAVADFVEKNISREDRICVVCGKGNNGGDGAAIGRLLFMRGYNVTIVPVAPITPSVPDAPVTAIASVAKPWTEPAKSGSLFELQLERARSLGVPVENRNKLDEYNIIIDAIFGIGLSRPVSGIYEQIINEINKNVGKVFSVDIPSGISADDGRVLNVAVKAHYTITFGYMKRGLLLYPGAGYAGKISVADIGLLPEALPQAGEAAFYYGPEDLRLLPARPDYSHKGSFGRVLVIAGSKGMAGAAFLSAKAAYRTGAGLVKVVTSEANRVIIQSLLPEALFASYDDNDDYCTEGCRDKLLADLKWASAVVIGPGLGKSDYARNLLDAVLSEAKVPVIIDADALNILSERLDETGSAVEERLKRLTTILGRNCIITPHLMELSRLIGKPVPDIKDNLIDTAAASSYNNELIYVIKDARTVVAHEGKLYINRSGNNGMATGGSGDVLTGIIGALIAQGLAPFEASCLGVYIHGLAGDWAAREKSRYSMIASDIIEAIGMCLRGTRAEDAYDA